MQSDFDIRLILSSSNDMHVFALIQGIDHRLLDLSIHFAVHCIDLDRIVKDWTDIILISIPILFQVYFNAGLAYGLAYFFHVPQNIAAPGALIGASNFFELAVAVSISLFGLQSGATLATVVGVLVEVPVMLSICNLCNRSRNWYKRRNP